MLKELVTELVLSSNAEILDKLAREPGAQAYLSEPPRLPTGRRNRRKRKALRHEYSKWGGADGFVYLPGSLPPEERVLLVAHVDTVGSSLPTHRQLTWRGNILTRDFGGILGADDRAGCAATWLFRDSGHSILWTDGEEIGGLGASRAVDLLYDELSLHAYAIQVDRAGDRCLALYSGSTSVAWETWLDEQLPGWVQERGSYTDIATICPAVGVCGANLAAGYMYQHSSGEVLFLDALERTVEALDRLICHVPDAPLFPERERRRHGVRDFWQTEAEDDTDSYESAYLELRSMWDKEVEDSFTADKDTPPARYNAAGDRIPS